MSLNHLLSLSHLDARSSVTKPPAAAQVSKSQLRGKAAGRAKICTEHTQERSVLTTPHHQRCARDLVDVSLQHSETTLTEIFISKKEYHCRAYHCRAYPHPSMPIWPIAYHLLPSRHDRSWQVMRWRYQASYAPNMFPCENVSSLLIPDQLHSTLWLSQV